MANEVIERTENTALQAVTGGGVRLPASVEVEARRAMMEVLSQVQAARMMPRSEMMPQVENELLALAKIPEFAERAIYAKPVGDDFVEGPSTYLAKQMASKYPNFQWHTIEHGIVDDQDQVECVTWDVENNNRSKAVVRVSHMRWSSKSRSAYKETNPTKIHDMVKSETSKTVRNLIFDNMPKLLLSRVTEACEATNDKSAIKLLENRKSMMEYFVKTFEVTEAQILKFVKRDKLADITSRDVRRLRALVQSFKQGEVKPSDIWESAKNIPVKGDAVAAATAAETEPAAEKQKNAKPKASGSTGGTKQTSAVGSTSKDTNTQQTAEASQSESSSEENQQSSTKSPSETQSESQGSDTSSTAKSAPSESTSAEPKEKPKPNALDKPTPDQVAAMEEAFK